MAEFFQPLKGVFEYVDQLPTSIAIRESQYFSPYLTVSHVVVMALVAGLVLMMDLRLMGVANMRTPFSELQRRLFPWQMGGLVPSTATGLLLCCVDPLKYYGNVMFRVKLALLAVAGINALAFHWTTYRTAGRWDEDLKGVATARRAGAVSLLLWFSVIVSGRLIAYNWFN